MQARIRNDSPSIKVRNDAPVFVRMAHLGLMPTSSVIPAGTPIGLLLTLTYASAVNIFKGESPTASIRSTD